MRTMTFTAAMNETFGRKPGQTLGEFQQELKALGPEDREYFKREFLKVGIQVQ
jgi:hypothetical protein